MKLYRVAPKNDNDQTPMLYAIDVVEGQKVYHAKPRSNRSPFGFRSQWRKDEASIALTPADAIRQYLKHTEERITEAEQELSDARKALNSRELARLREEFNV